MIDTLHEYRYIILVADILAWVWLYWALNRGQSLPASVQTPTPLPKSNPPLGRKPGDIVPQHRTTTGPMAPAIEAGMAEHHLRSAAATAKLQPITGPKAKPTESMKAIPGAPPPPTAEQLKLAEQKLPSHPRPTSTSGDDHGAMEDLFAGLKPTEVESRTGTGVIKKANRLEELGFHHEIESDRLPSQADSVAAPAKPRSQTAELDDILKRIDQVLADSPAPAPAQASASAAVTPAPAAESPKPTTPAVTPSAPPAAPSATPANKKTPAWARSDVQDEDLDPTAQRQTPTESIDPPPAIPPATPKKDADTDTPKSGDSQQKLF